MSGVLACVADAALAASFAILPTAMVLNGVVKLLRRCLPGTRTSGDGHDRAFTPLLLAFTLVLSGLWLFYLSSRIHTGFFISPGHLLATSSTATPSRHAPSLHVPEPVMLSAIVLNQFVLGCWFGLLLRTAVNRRTHHDAFQP